MRARDNAFNFFPLAILSSGDKIEVFKVNTNYFSFHPRFHIFQFTPRINFTTCIPSKNINPRFFSNYIVTSCNIVLTNLSNQLLEKRASNNQFDQQLVERVLNGDQQAFQVIIKNTEGLVAQIVFKMIRNREDRKDIVQDVYLKAYHNLPKFRFQSKLSTWVGQITYNTCLNFLEKKKEVLLENKFDDDLPMEDKLELLDNRFLDIYNNEIEIAIHRKELSALLIEEVDNLSPIYRTLITLYHSGELSYANIGEITQLPEGTVKNYLYRARKAIKERLLAKFKRSEL